MEHYRKHFKEKLTVEIACYSCKSFRTKPSSLNENAFLREISSLREKREKVLQFLRDKS